MANLPQPVNASQARPSAGQQILMALAQSLIQGGTQYGMAKLEQPMLLQRDAQQQSNAYASAANVATINQQGEMDRAAAIGDREIAVADAKRAADARAVAARRTAFIGHVKALDPKQVPIAEAIWDASPDGNIDASALARVLPPTVMETLQQAEVKSRTANAQLEFRQAAASEAGLNSIADKLGMPHGVLTKEAANDLAAAKDPNELSQKLYMEYSRPYTDPLTFTTTIRTPEQIKPLVQQAVAAYFPGYQLPSNVAKYQATSALMQSIMEASKQGMKLADIKASAQAAWNSGGEVAPDEFENAWRMATSAVMRGQTK